MSDEISVPLDTAQPHDKGQPKRRKNLRKGGLVDHPGGGKIHRPAGYSDGELDAAIKDAMRLGYGGTP